MDPLTYQTLAQRTMADQEAATERVKYYYNFTKDEDRQPFSVIPMQLFHAGIGMASEAGEYVAELQRWIYYGKELNVANIKEEIGDMLWYVAEACNALGFDMGEIMEANIRKLKIRYPHKYTDELAQEENRDRDLEMEAIEGYCADIDARTEVNSKEELTLDEMEEMRASLENMIDKVRNPNDANRYQCPHCRAWLGKRVVQLSLTDDGVKCPECQQPIEKGTVINA